MASTTPAPEGARPALASHLRLRLQGVPPWLTRSAVKEIERRVAELDLELHNVGTILDVELVSIRTHITAAELTRISDDMLAPFEVEEVI